MAKLVTHIKLNVLLGIYDQISSAAILNPITVVFPHESKRRQHDQVAIGSEFGNMECRAKTGPFDSSPSKSNRF